MAGRASPRVRVSFAGRAGGGTSGPPYPLARAAYFARGGSRQPAVLAVADLCIRLRTDVYRRLPRKLCIKKRVSGFDIVGRREFGQPTPKETDSDSRHGRTFNHKCDASLRRSRVPHD